MNPEFPSAVFVYGTLKRGQCRESMWPTMPTSVREVYVFGRLFGRADYPAMTTGDHRVLGELWGFQSDEMPSVLAALDRIEGTNQPGFDDLYDRVITQAYLTNGQRTQLAFTYHYATDPAADGFKLIQPQDDDAYVAWPAGS